MIDFIGDIHVHVEKLVELFEKLGYRNENGIYSHATRKGFLLGDFIDHGPQITVTLKIANAIVDSGNAIAM